MFKEIITKASSPEAKADHEKNCPVFFEKCNVCLEKFPFGHRDEHEKECALVLANLDLNARIKETQEKEIALTNLSKDRGRHAWKI